jgi:hypothetical protein
MVRLNPKGFSASGIWSELAEVSSFFILQVITTPMVGDLITHNRNILNSMVGYISRFVGNDSKVSACLKDLSNLILHVCITIVQEGNS